VGVQLRANSVEAKMSGSSNDELSEAIVKNALENLDWHDLKQHLDSISFDSDDLDELLGHIKRHSKFIAKYPAPVFEGKRNAFLDAIEGYALAVIGPDGPLSVRAYRTTLQLIEGGYRGILDMLDRAEVSKLPATLRVSSYIARAAGEHDLVMKKANEAAMRNGALDIAGATLLKDEDGNAYSPDAVIGSIVMTLGATLGMEGHRNKWWAADGRLVIPEIVSTTQDDIYKVGSGTVLGMLWRRWERAEEKHRFLEGELRELDVSEWPTEVPANIKRLLVSSPGTLDLLDFVANERLGQQSEQGLMHLLTRTGIREQVVGIAGTAALPPTKYVSVEEAHAVLALSNMLAFNVLSDAEERGGLTLAEWIRGYSLLKAMAQDLSEENRTDPILVPRETLGEALVRVGLTADKAGKFVDQVTFARPSGNAKASRDLYDCPLVATGDGSYVLVTSALLGSHVAMLTMSNASRHGEEFSRKGKAFEAAVHQVFRRQGLPCLSFKHETEWEKYEFDAIVPWGEYVFLFECKNHGLSGYDPIRAHHFAQGLASDMNQVRRQAEELRTNSKLIVERLGKEWVGKTVIATVLNCLPYAIPMDDDADVLVSDIGIVRRFFEERYFHANQYHPLENKAAVLNRTEVVSQWSGATPTPEDLLRILRNPLQFKILKDHVIMDQSSYPIAEDTLVLSYERLRTNTTNESFASAAGGNPQRVKQTIAKADAVIRQAKLQHSKRSAKKRDRLWREMQKRKAI
jgi:hypothetical protein